MKVFTDEFKSKMKSARTVLAFPFGVVLGASIIIAPLLMCRDISIKRSAAETNIIFDGTHWRLGKVAEVTLPPVVQMKTEVVPATIQTRLVSVLPRIVKGTGR